MPSPLIPRFVMGRFGNRFLGPLTPEPKLLGPGSPEIPKMPPGSLVRRPQEPLDFRPAPVIDIPSGNSGIPGLKKGAIAAGLLGGGAGLASFLGDDSVASPGPEERRMTEPIPPYPNQPTIPGGFNFNPTVEPVIPSMPDSATGSVMPENTGYRDYLIGLLQQQQQKDNDISAMQLLGIDDMPERQEIPMPERGETSKWRQFLGGFAEGWNDLEPGTITDRKYREAMQDWSLKNQLEDQRYNDALNKFNFGLSLQQQPGADPQIMNNLINEIGRMERHGTDTGLERERLDVTRDLNADKALQWRSQIANDIQSGNMDRALTLLRHNENLDLGMQRFYASQEPEIDAPNSDENRARYAELQFQVANDPESQSAFENAFKVDGTNIIMRNPYTWGRSEEESSLIVAMQKYVMGIMGGE